MSQSGGGASAAVLLLFANLAAQTPAPLEGAVEDATGAWVSGAQVSLTTAGGTLVGAARSDAFGKFRLEAVYPGAYALRVAASGFETALMRLETPLPQSLRVQLEVARLSLGITVTAERANIQDAWDTPQMSCMRLRDDIAQRPVRTVGQALEGESNVHVQETTAGQSSPILRGLTGYQTLLLVDDIRLNTSMFRSGPNQYLAFFEPSQMESLETVLGPVSSMYGSDSLGGTVHLHTLTPHSASLGTKWFHGQGGILGGSGALSLAGDLTLSAGMGNWWALFNTGLQHLGDMRTGGAEDSHGVFLRYFDLPQKGRLPETGYNQLGFLVRSGYRLPAGNDLSFTYSRSGIHNLRAYRELLGGLGRLQSFYEPQSIDFLYGRWEKLRWGRFDSIRTTVSRNAQNDSSRRQGLRYADTVTDERNQVVANGVTTLASLSPTGSTWLGFGADLYDETISSSRLEFYPSKGSSSAVRPLYPDGSKYRTWGSFVQGRWESRARRFAAGASGRFTGVSATLGSTPTLTPASRNQSFSDFTWSAHGTWRPTQRLALALVGGRGFRAPNLNDLGNLGLTGLGFEVPVTDAIASGGLMGIDGSEGALSDAAVLKPLRPETLLNGEGSIRYSTSRLSVRGQFFFSSLRDPIVRRTILFPATAIPVAVGGVPVTVIKPTAAQQAAGVVPVASSLDPRAIKSFVNDGIAHYRGLEAGFIWKPVRRTFVEGSYSWLAGRELDPSLPVRRLPPQQGYLTARFAGSPSRPWFEATLLMQGSQARWNPADYDDERMGASRRRSDIASFFSAGINASNISPGADGVSGNADDLYIPTMETLRQTQDRVLPIGSMVHGVLVINDNTRVPLYNRTPGWWVFRIRTGMPLGEHCDLVAGIDNLFDRNYRVHGSGIDGGGLSVFTGIRFRF